LPVKKIAVRKPRVFAIAQGPISGSIHIVAPSAGGRAAYDWQYSTDGGKTWIDLPTTLQAKTSASGLAAASTVTARYRVATKTGEGDWSQPLSFLVK